MNAIVIYESMYGNTHIVAEHIAEGLRAAGEARVVSVGEATAELLAAANLVVIGGPTHVHGMSSESTRRAAITGAPKSQLQLDPAATDEGLRDWFGHIDHVHGTAAAAFDTRMSGPPVLTGRASRRIARRLSDSGYRLVTEPESFIVDHANHLLPGEADRATEWGAALAKASTQVSH
jgi:Flavodoxin